MLSRNADLYFTSKLLVTNTWERIMPDDTVDVSGNREIIRLHLIPSVNNDVAANLNISRRSGLEVKCGLQLKMDLQYDAR